MAALMRSAPSFFARQRAAFISFEQGAGLWIHQTGPRLTADGAIATFNRQRADVLAAAGVYARGGNGVSDGWGDAVHRDDAAVLRERIAQQGVGDAPGVAADRLE